MQGPKDTSWVQSGPNMSLNDRRLGRLRGNISESIHCVLFFHMFSDVWGLLDGGEYWKPYSNLLIL